MDRQLPGSGPTICRAGSGNCGAEWPATGWPQWPTICGPCMHPRFNHYGELAFQEHFKQNPLVRGLAEMEAADRKQFEMSALLQPAAVPQPSTWNTKFWRMFWLFLIGVSVAGAVYGLRRRRRHPPTHAAPPQLENELNQLSPLATSALHAATPPSPPDKKLLMFTGHKT